MPAIHYNALSEYLNGLRDPENGRVAPVYLIYGEESLYKRALKGLLAVLIPDSDQSLNYDRIEGGSENIQEAILRINTFSLLPGKKVVAICDAQIFYTQQDETGLLKKAKQAFDNNDIGAAAKYLLSILSLLNLSFEDIRKGSRSKTLRLDENGLDNDKWVEETVNYCVENDLSVPPAADTAGLLEKTIQTGFPKGNHLIITTDRVDKRRKLYQRIRNSGMIIDCSVPKGDRMADRAAQEAVLKKRMKEILTEGGKRMDKGAYTALNEMTGFDLRTFSSNLEKLVNYVGDRKEITANDVQAVLKRTKKDPIYEFTNAVTDKNIEKAFFYMESLLSGGDIDHPLQLLAAMLKQFRRLLMIKDFVESAYGSDWHGGNSFGHFKTRVMPAMQAFDKVLLNQLEDWEGRVSGHGKISPESEKAKSSEKKKPKKSKLTTDLGIVKNPNNPYPVYQMLKKSERFTKQELLAALNHLSETDLRIKSLGQNPKIVLEDLLFRIFGTV